MKNLLKPINTETNRPHLRSLLLPHLFFAFFMVNSIIAQAEQVEHTYDDLNRLVKIDYENGNYIEYSYDAAGNRISQNSVAAKTPYNFSGFFPPVDNLSTQNEVKAGSAVPVKFSLAGDQGLNIFAANYPASRQISCDTTAQTTAIEEAELTTSNSGLSYDSDGDQYKYVWKTLKSWKGTCRQLTLKLDDNSEQKANFTFK